MRLRYAYIAVSILDLTLTIVLLQRSIFYEANPIARFILKETGLGGLAFYKALLVSVFCVICSMLTDRKSVYTRFLDTFAVLITGGVCAYSVWLMITYA